MSENKDRIEGVKAIADYLGISVRNVYRWRKLGLPIYHMGGHQGGRVYALKAELDEWVAKEQNSKAKSINNRKFLVSAVALVLVIVVIGVSILFFVFFGENREDRIKSLNPVIAVPNETLVLIKNINDEILWSYCANEDTITLGKWEEYRILQMLDTDGDQLSEIVTSVYDKQQDTYHLALFDHTGEILWKTMAENEQSFAGLLYKTYYKPYQIRLLTTAKEETKIITLWGHRGRFPCVLTAHNTEGELLHQYVNMGQTSHMEIIDLNVDGKLEIIFSGTNNLLNGDGFVCVVPADNFSGVSPPYRVEPEHMSEFSRLNIYVPDDPVRGNQLFYLRLKRTKYLSKYKSTHLFGVFDGISDGLVQIWFIPIRTIMDDKPANLGFMYVFDSNFSLQYSFPDAACVKNYPELLRRGDITMSLEELAAKYDKIVYRWQDDGTWQYVPSERSQSSPKNK